MIKKVSSFLHTVRGKGRRDSKRTGRPGSLLRDARGTIAVYVAISAPVLLGIGALTLDLTRIMGVNTALQSAADAAAMAGADELDRFSGARDRAKATAKDAVANLQTFATGAAEVTISTADCAGVAAGDSCMRFLKTLPAGDGDPITNANLAATDKEARFIEAHVGTPTITLGYVGCPCNYAGALDPRRLRRFDEGATPTCSEVNVEGLRLFGRKAKPSREGGTYVDMRSGLFALPRTCQMRFIRGGRVIINFAHVVLSADAESDCRAQIDAYRAAVPNPEYAALMCPGF